MIPGHQTPTKQLAQRFCEYVTDFLDANPDNGKCSNRSPTHSSLSLVPWERFPQSSQPCSIQICQHN
ncbi:hypothetical protein AWZ03_011967 [Drosophila navojoa]|uniref:Uncharacterized protein n=1 Tax=Drosophila navojoa TaxID=7232 RepID=A0A484AZ28_DRONA|nr:hypothetical protein AWZ03_011967 [Drosophila navojoa]